MKQKEWIIEFNENGGEYRGSLRIMASSLKKLTATELLADKVLIEIDEDITDITRVREQPTNT